MAKSKTTVTQAYWQGEKQIADFMKGEIGTEKQMEAKREKFRDKVSSQFTRDQISLPENKAKILALYDELDKSVKAEHHQYFNDFKAYGEKLRKFFAKEEEARNDGRRETIDSDDLEDLMQRNADSQDHVLFKSNRLSWSSPSGIKAVAKFANLLLKNDARKLESYQNQLEKSGDPVSLKDILAAPTPVTKIPRRTDMEDLAANMRDLEEKLKKTEGFHVNSSEFNAMKTAIRAVNQGLADGIEPAELGSRLEALQAASMDYVKAKGVGTQSTQRGKDRMDAALDICSLATDGMDYFASKERRAELEMYEEKQFGSVLTEDIMDNDRLEPMTEIYKEDSQIKAKKIEEPGMQEIEEEMEEL